MNYEKEINAFYDCIERNPVSASAGALWIALMHINSKTMWAATFTVPAPVLRLKSGLSVSSFKGARTELKEKRFINYQSRDKNQAAVYRMFSLVLDGNEQAGWDEEQHMNQEVIPEWFKEQKRKEKLKREQKQAEMELQDPEAEYAEVERMLEPNSVGGMFLKVKVKCQAPKQFRTFIVPGTDLSKKRNTRTVPAFHLRQFWR